MYTYDTGLIIVAGDIFFKKYLVHSLFFAFNINCFVFRDNLLPSKKQHLHKNNNFIVTCFY